MKNYLFKGPIFTNIVLADELNRGSPKSQSAFLEAMEKKTFLLMELLIICLNLSLLLQHKIRWIHLEQVVFQISQLDRFMISFSLSDLSENEKILMLKKNINFQIKIQLL